MTAEKATTQGRTLVGRAIRPSRQQSVVVEMVRQVRHPKYHKYVRHRSRVMVHDEDGQVRAGDVVRIRECRPLSKRKAWRIEAILVRADESAPRAGQAEESHP
ncbi:MAG: 30S ribosomal protein S17 [Gammaproteobacteria bacterium]